MIQEHLARQTAKLEGGEFLAGVKSRNEWEKVRPQFVEEYFYMLGLRPMPEKTPLRATVTGTLQQDGYAVENLHYQSRPGLYVTGNLYRPAKTGSGRLPAVLYVCGHSGQGRNGNKTAYQSHGIWFARHGYVCLVLDSLQLGEIAAIHHGTYREGRWWWHARGYTPAGVECLNGLRGIDYLQSRPDVDPDRIAVTGISGGGAATFWIAAADPRAKVAVPVSGMADLESYVSNRVINGHCDCMFLYNTFQWPWTRIAALIAPRPMLFTNSDADPIFPMDANDRVINRLERVYSLYGASDAVDAMVSIGGHAYRQDLRQAAFRFINHHLKGDPRTVTDSETDLVADEKGKKRYPIELEKLRVFPTDADLPKDELNTAIDRHFVPQARVAPPPAGEFEPWKAKLLAELRRVTFRPLPERIPPATLSPLPPAGEGSGVREAGARKAAGAEEPKPAGDSQLCLQTEPGIRITLERPAGAKRVSEPKRVLLIAACTEQKPADFDWIAPVLRDGDEAWVCSPRGVGATRWTRKDPPNYVERSHALLGRTVDEGRVWDLIAAARHFRAKHGGNVPVCVAGGSRAALLAAYAALLEPEIDEAFLRDPPLSHMDAAAPPLLNVLRVCDVPEVLGMIAPRRLTIYADRSEALAKAAALHAAAGQPGKLTIKQR
jgi:dienelactone hydrolase